MTGILVIVDWFSKMSCYIPLNMNITAQGVAKISWDQVFKDMGIPQKVISNRGPWFVLRFMKELCSWLGIERNPSTTYHPQTDGQTEQVNQELEQYLQLYCNYRQNDWAEWLSIAEFSYNNQIHSSTGQSPFMVNLGCHLNTSKDINLSTKNSPGTEQFLKMIKEIRNEVESAQSSRDLVWVDATHYNTDQPSKKLSAKQVGPFQYGRSANQPTNLRFHPHGSLFILSSMSLILLLTWHPHLSNNHRNLITELLILTTKPTYRK